MTCKENVRDLDHESDVCGAGEEPNPAFMCYTDDDQTAA